jgi:hypothetical protein
MDPTESLTLQERADVWHAYRIIRAKPGGATHKRLIKTATPRVMTLVTLLPRHLATECHAEAERRAIMELRAANH